MNKAPLVADIVKTWLEHGEQRPTLCFCVDRAHAKYVQEQFLQAGVACGYIDAFTKIPDREIIKARLERGALKVVCNVGCLTTGVDWDVRCIILARPTRSEMLFVQIIGRGLRLAEGKTDCIARDSLILTDHGNIKIQSLTLDHKVWDGVSFVSHGGAICKGIQRVIEYDGVVATPDHRVMTREGWMEIEKAARRAIRIVRTGICGVPVRFIEDNFPLCDRDGGYVASERPVSEMLGAAHGSLSQYQKETKNSRMSVLQWSKEDIVTTLDISAVPGTKRSLHKSEESKIQRLRRTRNTISFRESKRCCIMGCGKPGNTGPEKFAIGQNKQRWTLRAGKPPMGVPCREYEQYETFHWSPPAFSEFPSEIPVCQICGCNAKQAHHFPYGRADRGKMEFPIVQTEREVWDVLNSGPLQRFTANGRLVHNCVIFDHSDNHARLGFVTDIHHETLHTGTGPSKAEAKVPVPKECPECKFLRPPKVSTCPNCGFKPPPPIADIEVEEGELGEITSRPKRGKGTKDGGPKNHVWIKDQWIPFGQFYGELAEYAAEKGYAGGWVSHKFREATGVWPNHWRSDRKTVSIVVRRWLKSRAIAFAKARETMGSATAE